MTLARIPETAVWELLPEHIREGVREYVEQGRPLGGFLEAVFANDLNLAASRADPFNRECLADIADFVRWYTPLTCRGSYERVEAWRAAGRAALEAERGR